MDVLVDYETVCVNCKEKGYSFGYTFKTIKYKNRTVMDIPTRYLNGPCIAFEYKEIPILIRSLENSHHLGVAQKTPLFTMINAKRNNDSTITRFTYLYSPQYHPEIVKKKIQPERPDPRVLEYVDIYRYHDKPYILMFYSFRNSTHDPLRNFNFYQFYDFDINGEEGYKTDSAEYDEKLNIAFQYDAQEGKQLSPIVGIGTINDNIPTHFECNAPQDLLITPERLNLKDCNRKGPAECAVGLQWHIPSIGPGQMEVFPVMMVFGLGEENFKANVLEARAHLEKISPSIFNVVNGKFRQLIDPELEKMSFSMREWCKD
ncbi:hypothetical protein NEF87_004727 [Candidatus Lokiarchaeum ossiferum]|uniref:Uncharacterized protein n=1 Tax=Candidatus Lokiarchaeum ossiferum TaxID=2951803 RepID=A0ABY6I1I8_9ARCH|nr:hypothetical protein NEF87_004727 [Candidatus Lokiarchaeum sp. B-35]